MKYELAKLQETPTHSVYSDHAGTGCILNMVKLGEGAGRFSCMAPAVVKARQLALCVHLAGVKGVRAYVTDVGVYGSWWISTGAGWVPAEPIWCTGTPEGVITAPVGSLATRTDGGVSTTLYVKQSGAGNTGWVAK